MDDILYTVAPSGEPNPAGIEFKRSDGVFTPVRFIWQYFTTGVTTSLSSAVYEAIGISSLSAGQAFTVVTVIRTDNDEAISGDNWGWEIERTLPFVAFRGDTYNVVPDFAIDRFITELENE